MVEDTTAEDFQERAIRICRIESHEIHNSMDDAVELGNVPKLNATE